ncbi:putative cyclase [Panus rudis PR-1116 ss-1]|nr:putative cyclase [Panus rudis PR-1116 ss-1]
MHDLSTTSAAQDKKRKIIDLTHPLTPAAVPACPGHPSYNAQKISDVTTGDFATVHTLTLGTHTGTHIDAPYHFFGDGSTVDELDLSLLTAAPAILVDLRSKKPHDRITWDDLKVHEGRMRRGVVLLLATGWSRNWTKAEYSDHPFLDVDAAEKILATGVRVIGVDAMSPDEVIPGKGDTGDVHRKILSNGGVIVENLNGLEKVIEAGVDMDRLVVNLLPLKLTQCDGSPIRAVAWES